MSIDLSARITAWKREEEKKREAARLKRAKSRAKLRGVLIADISPTKKEKDKYEKDMMIKKYPQLLVRRLPRVDGTWGQTEVCDIRRASHLLNRPMKELYISLGHSKGGFLRTPAYEVIVIVDES
jgi:hypothetical protein